MWGASEEASPGAGASLEGGGFFPGGTADIQTDQGVDTSDSQSQEILWEKAGPCRQGT